MVRVRVNAQKFEAERVAKTVEEKQVWNDDGWKKLTRTVVHVYPTDRDPIEIMETENLRLDQLEHGTQRYDVRVKGDIGAVIQTDEWQADNDQIRFFGEFETRDSLDYRTGNDF